MPLAHRCHFVGKKNSTFEKVKFPEKFHAAQGKKTLVQIGQPKVEAPETALLGDVMNRQHSREWQVMRSHINWHERGRPIVDVQNLRCRSQATCQFHRSFAEKNETRGVIFVGGAMFAINSVAIEEFVAADEK